MFFKVSRYIQRGIYFHTGRLNNFYSFQIKKCRFLFLPWSRWRLPANPVHDCHVTPRSESVGGYLLKWVDEYIAVTQLSCWSDSRIRVKLESTNNHQLRYSSTRGGQPALQCIVGVVCWMWQDYLWLGVNLRVWSMLGREEESSCLRVQTKGHDGKCKSSSSFFLSSNRTFPVRLIGRVRASSSHHESPEPDEGRTGQQSAQVYTHTHRHKLGI